MTGIFARFDGICVDVFNFFFMDLIFSQFLFKCNLSFNLYTGGGVHLDGTACT